MKDEDKLEDLFKEKFENFEADVNPSVWKNVQTALKGFGIGILVKTLLNKIGTNTIIAVVSSAATVISTVMVMNWSNGKKAETSENKPATSQAVVETTVPETANNVIVTKEVKPEITSSTIEKEATVTHDQTKTFVKTDKKEMESVINKFSGKPIANIFASPVGGTVPLIVSLMNNGTGKTNKWTYGDSKAVETETSPVHIYNEPGIYTVKLTSTNAEGKTTIDSVKIEVKGNSSVAIPTDFSPNGDNNKDEFVLKGENMKHLSAIIFDKKGKTVYEKQGGEDIIWNGKNLEGHDVKEGTYYYIINAEGVDGKKYEQKGSINLTR